MSRKPGWRQATLTMDGLMSRKPDGDKLYSLWLRVFVRDLFLTIMMNVLNVNGISPRHS